MPKITRDDVESMLQRYAIHYRDLVVTQEGVRDELITDYLEDLGAMERGHFWAAVAEARRTCRFFPRSADILEAARRVTPTRADAPALPPSPAMSETMRERNRRRAAELVQALASGKRPEWARR